MSNAKHFITLAIVALVAGSIGWLLGNRQDSLSNQNVERTTGHDAAQQNHSHGDEWHSHPPSDLHPRVDEGRHRGGSGTTHEEAESQTPENPVTRLERAMASRERIREENESILREILSGDEIRALYREKLEDPDLSLYDDEGNRLSEEEFVANWSSDYGIKTPEMKALMEAASWAPVESALEKARFSLQEIDESVPTDSELENDALTPAEAEERRRAIRLQEAETIRAELLTREEIEALYDEKVSEKSSEVYFPGGGRITKDEYVREYIESHGELTSELNEILNEYGTH